MSDKNANKSRCGGDAGADLQIVVIAANDLCEIREQDTYTCPEPNTSFGM